jgi:hypothetical protein
MNDMTTWIDTYLKRFDPITLFVLALVWYNLHNDFGDRIDKLNIKIEDINTRLTVIETVMLIENRIPSHVAKGDGHE